jgi:hypothetical protein
MKTEDIILKHIKAGDWRCLANCRAHAYDILHQKEYQGGLSFAVYVGDDLHKIQIRLNHAGDYDVSLTRLALNGKIITVESGTCQGEELAEVITSMCNREVLTGVVTVQQVESMNTPKLAMVIIQAIHAEDPWCLVNCAASEVTPLKPCEDYHGGLAFRVVIRPDQIHTITIRLTPKQEYEVMLSRFDLNVTRRLETATCPLEALAEVITRMCK